MFTKAVIALTTVLVLGAHFASAAPANKNQRSSIETRVPETGAVTYVDKVFGKVTTPNTAQQDFVLLRSDGVPLYNFGAVVDDVTMGITLVSRGRDHMVNTPPQILL